MSISRGWVCLLLYGFCLTLIGCNSGCSNQRNQYLWPTDNKKPRILTTTVPIYCFTAHLAEPECEVRCLRPGSGVHVQEFGQNDYKLVHGAHHIFANGLNLQPFLQRLIRGSGNREVKLFYVAEKAIPKKQRIQSTGFVHGDHVHAGGDDMHVWLGLDEARLMVQAIRDQLISIDKNNEAKYQERADKLLARLDQLKKKSIPLHDLKKLPGRVITDHDAFRYFARSCFGDQFPPVKEKPNRLIGALRGLEEEDLGTQGTRELIDLCVKIHNAGETILIAVEPGPEVRERQARTLGKNIGERVKIIQLDPIESAETVNNNPYKVNKDIYFLLMKENIDTLLKALKQ